MLHELVENQLQIVSQDSRNVRRKKIDFFKSGDSLFPNLKSCFFSIHISQM